MEATIGIAGRQARSVRSDASQNDESPGRPAGSPHVDGDRSDTGVGIVGSSSRNSRAGAGLSETSATLQCSTTSQRCCCRQSVPVGGDPQTAVVHLDGPAVIDVATT